MNARSAAATATSALALLLAGCGGGGASPPPDGATRLVPADALVYVHVSIDTSRGATAAAAAIAKRFPGYVAARRALLERLSAPGCRLSRGTGKEAALAIVPTEGTTAGSLVLLDTGSDSKVAERICGQVRAAKIGRFLVLGQPATLAAARRLAAGKGRSLADQPDYRRATGDLPAGRVLDAWATTTGVRRLLAPQNGLLGVAGTLVDQPDLKGVALGLAADGATRARLVVKTLLTKAHDSRTFTPTLPGELPSGVLGYLGVAGLGGAAQRLLPALGAGSAQLGPLLARAGADLAPVAALFSPQAAVTLARATPAPILTLAAPTKDEAAATRTLARARPLIAKLLKPAKGRTPAWRQTGGVWQLTPAQGIELDYAVFDGKVVASTRAAGVRALRDVKTPLAQAALFTAVKPDLGNPSTSVGFLDFNQLLRLGEQTGLNDNEAFLKAKNDLRKVTAVGARTTGQGDETTAELLLSIP